MANYKPKNIFSEEPKSLFPEEPEQEGYFTRHFLNPIKGAVGKNELDTLGNVAKLMFVNPIEATGLPSAAHGAFQSAENVIRGIGNVPADIAEYMGHKFSPTNIPGTKQQIYPIPKSEFPKPENVNPYVGETGEITGSILGLSPLAKVYQGVKGGINAIPYAKNLPNLTKGLLAAEATGFAGTPENRGLGASLGVAGELTPYIGKLFGKGINRYRTKPPFRELEAAEKNLIASQQAEEALKNQASYQFGQQNPEKLLMSAQDKARALEEGQGFVQQHQTPEMQQARPGEQSISEAQYGVNNMHDVMKQILGEGESHNPKLASSIINDVEGIPVMRPHPKTGLPREVREGGLKEEIANKWDKLEKGLPDIEIPGSVPTDEIEKEVTKFLGSKAVSEEEKQKIRELFTKSHPGSKNKTVNGREFFRGYRALRQAESKQRSKAFDPGVSVEAHDQWIERADKIKQTYENMEKIIKDHFPSDTIKRLNEINHEWSTKVAPLDENPAYRYMKKNLDYSNNNIIENLEGNTKGNVILRSLIQNNPEYARLAIGQKYAANPQNLLKPNQALEPYARANPEISRLMSLQQEAHQNLERATQNDPIVQQLIKNRELQQEIAAQTKMAKKLKSASEETGIDKGEVEKRKQAFKEVNDRVNRLKNRARKTAKWGAIGAFTAGTGYLGGKAAQR